MMTKMMMMMMMMMICCSCDYRLLNSEVWIVFRSRM